MSKIFYVTSFLLATALSVFAKDKCMILSGQNNHDWASTAPVLKTLVEIAGDFDVVVNNSPESLTSDLLKDVKLIVSNWNALGAKKWSQEAFKAYDDFVNNGGGVVSVHAGTTYPNAPESYNKIGIGTWSGKTFHSRYEAFEVKVKDHTHPVMKGIKDFMTRDELWSNVEFTGDYKVLANSVAIGSPYIERILGKDSKELKVLQASVVAAEIKKGKCVTIFLGHDVMAMGNLGFMDIFANAVLWSSGKDVKGGLINKYNLDKVASAISAQVENGNMSFMRCLENFAFDSDDKIKSQIVSVLLEKVISNKDTAAYFKRRAWNLIADILTKSDISKISKFNNDKENSEFAKAAIEKFNFTPPLPAKKIEFKKFANSDIQNLLKKYDTLSDDEKVVALTQFYYADFKPALSKAKQDANSESKDVALNALRTLSKLATPSDYGFYIDLLKTTKDIGRKRTITESLMSVRNDGFDAIKTLSNSSDEDFPIYTNIALVQNSNETLNIAISRILNSNIDAKETLNILMPYADKNNIANILSLYGKSPSTDSALSQSLVNFLRKSASNFDLVKSVFEKLNDVQKQKVLQALSVCATKDMFDFVFELANSKDAKNSEMALNALSSWRSVENIMTIADVEKIGDKKSIEILYSILTLNKNAVLNPNDLIKLSKIFNESRDTKYANLAKRLGEVVQSAKAKGSKNLAKGATAESIYKYGPDGQGGLPSAAIDGDKRTYWDEVDGKGLYGLKITLPKKEKISQIRILRYNEVWSPDGFEIFVDGKSVKKVGFAVYENHKFNLNIDANGSVIELKFDNVPTGKSPAIRELEIY